MTLGFEKWHGIGNDFVIVDGSSLGPDCDLAELASQMCARTFGVGADGLLIAHASTVADLKMVMYNPDGSESEMCGNGIRCFAMWAKPRTGKLELEIETGAGIRRTRILDDQVEVEMGDAMLLDGPESVMLGSRSFDSLAISMGNPHLVVFAQPDDQIPVAEWGSELEHLPQFPNRTNVHFVRKIGPDRVRQQTWERGAGETLACGTGACAVAFAAHRRGWVGDRMVAELPGGELKLTVVGEQITMTGSAVRTFTGEWRGRRGGWPDEL